MSRRSDHSSRDLVVAVPVVTVSLLPWMWVVAASLRRFTLASGIPFMAVGTSLGIWLVLMLLGVVRIRAAGSGRVSALLWLVRLPGCILSGGCRNEFPPARFLFLTGLAATAVVFVVNVAFAL
jgi:hypothetical protein